MQSNQRNLEETDIVERRRKLGTNLFHVGTVRGNPSAALNMLDHFAPVSNQMVHDLNGTMQIVIQCCDSLEYRSHDESRTD